MAQQELITIDGQPVLRRVAEAEAPGGDPLDAAARHTGDLLREAAILQAAAHPGVVPLVRWEPGPPQALLVAYVGTRTLDRQLHLPLWQVAAICASAARTIADLHRRGIARCSLDPASITLDAQGEPVLCNFSAATADPSPEDRYDDVVALGALIMHLLERAGTPPASTPLGLRCANSADAGVRDALLSLADRADATSAATPWGAERLAALLDPLASPPRARWRMLARRSDASSSDRESPDGTVHRAPDGTVHRAGAPRPHGRSAQPQPDGPARRDRYPAVAASVAAVLGGVALLGWPLASEPDRAESREPDAAVDREAPIAADAMSGSTQQRPAPHVGISGVDPAGAPPSAPTEASSWTPDTSSACREDHRLDEPIGGAWCLSEVRVEGATVQTPSGRFVLGDSDDLVLVDDWRCNGSPTAALLRRPEGEVYVFDAWSAPSGAATATAALVEPSVVTLTATWTGVCRLLVATRADGTSFGVPLEDDGHHDHHDLQDLNP